MILTIQFKKFLSSGLLCKNVKTITYETVIFLVVLYGCETLFPTLREEHKLRMFKKTMLRRIFGLKREKVAGGRRKVHNEELHNLYSSLGIIRIIKSMRMKWAWHVARMGRRIM
jgi:hypothetical protein